MLRFINYDIVFQEIPDEVTLAVNISNCPNRCKGCHSPYLMEDAGAILNENILVSLLERYGNAVTCVCFMGGDSSPQDVERLAAFLQRNYGLKTGWYSGKSDIPDNCTIHNFNYIKLGPYIERLGGLNSATTNQRFYRVENGNMIDITNRFYENTFRM
ncbi:MAG: anaerobic ribonucleoside-triphosphate reductase activating protein [Prevotellaceae bacterium]|nr:anaerobic ribonucleoside-triphosphate reductase activating protein [Prevotellaceae bacterium]